MTVRTNSDGSVTAVTAGGRGKSAGITAGMGSAAPNQSGTNANSNDPGTPDNSEADFKTALMHIIGSGGSGSSSSNSTGSVSTNDPGGTPDQNKTIAKQMLPQYGWNVDEQFPFLDKLWTQESNWNQEAINSSSGACSIVQALPCNKLPKEGQPKAVGGGGNASVAIKWGLDYIKERYGSPEQAWAHEEANNWY